MMMNLKPETVKKVAYPALAAVMATAALGAAPQERIPQRLGGKSPAPKRAETEVQPPKDPPSDGNATPETKELPPQRLGGVPRVPKKSPSGEL